MREAEIQKQFKHIYLAHFAKMKYFAKAYVVSTEEAENIVQDVFTELWGKKDILTMDMNLVAYLFTATKNKCLNYLRHQVVKRESATEIQEEYRLAMKASLNSLEIFDAHVFSRQDIEDVLNQAIENLSDRCRQIFIMNKIEGKKQKEIAAELNISLNTVEVQMGIAYKRLRKELKDYLPMLLFLFQL